MKRYFILLILSILALNVVAQSNKILGVWYTQSKDARIEIYKSEGKYFGKIVWMQNLNNPETGKPQLDINNPDETKRDQPVLGSIMLWDFVYNENEYQDGKLYDGRDGKIYDGKMWLEGANTLKVRGYLGFFFGTETWSRVQK